MDLPSEDSLRWIVSRYASLRAAHGEGIGEPVLVQPTSEYFPDRFEPSVAGASGFLDRMLDYAPVASGLDVQLRVVDLEGEGGSRCGSGTCLSTSGATAGELILGDRVLETDEGYIVELPSNTLGHPLRLASSLARSVGTIVLSEANEGVAPGDIGAFSELAATAVGLGVLLLEGAHVVRKSCGGVRIERSTHLDVVEVAVAVSFFARLHAKKPSEAKSCLAVTQREALEEAIAWVDSNSDLLDDLDERPELLVGGNFRIHPTKGLVGRWLSGSRSPPKRMAPRRSARTDDEVESID